MITIPYESKEKEFAENCGNTIPAKVNFLSSGHMERGHSQAVTTVELPRQTSGSNWAG